MDYNKAWGKTAENIGKYFAKGLAVDKRDFLSKLAIDRILPIDGNADLRHCRLIGGVCDFRIAGKASGY